MLLSMLDMSCCQADTVHHDAYYLWVLVTALQQQASVVKTPSFCIQENMILLFESGMLVGLKLWLLHAFLWLS